MYFFIDIQLYDVLYNRMKRYLIFTVKKNYATYAVVQERLISNETWLGFQLVILNIQF